jgi:hypothetical protein
MHYLILVIANPLTPWLFGIALSGWAVCSGIRMWWKVAQVRSSLEQGRTQIDQAADSLQFARDFESISSSLLKIKYVGQRWHDFKETLIVPPAPNKPIRATAPAEHWFDLSLLADAKLGQRYHALLSNLLVGAGLLFTFVGLAVALSTAGGVAEGIDQQP